MFGFEETVFDCESHLPNDPVAHEFRDSDSDVSLESSILWRRVVSEAVV
jgi:hypothetical protein